MKRKNKIAVAEESEVLRKKLKLTWGVTQVVEHLPSRHEALSSIPVQSKKKEKKNQWNVLDYGI
jgi:hypothetical protein